MEHLLSSFFRPDEEDAEKKGEEERDAAGSDTDCPREKKDAACVGGGKRSSLIDWQKV